MENLHLRQPGQPGKVWGNLDNVPRRSNVPNQGNVPYQGNVSNQGNMPYQGNVPNQGNVPYQGNVSNQGNMPSPAILPKVVGDRVITGEVRFSYANVFVPIKALTGEDRYCVSLLIPKSDAQTINAIRAVIEGVMEKGKVKFGSTFVQGLKLPVRDGDAERPGDPVYAGHYFINAGAKYAPGVVDANLDPITDARDFYSGCYGRASVTFFAFKRPENKGVACALNNVQKLREGELLGGMKRIDPRDEFGDF